jgi:hypothetical protein
MTMMVPMTAVPVAIPSGQVDKIRRAAVGALIQVRVKGSIEHMSAALAADQIPLEMDISPIDPQMSAFGQKQGNLVPGFFHQTGKRRTGNFHVFR